ncbi:unnamed protein product [Pleuronectes platessa]|uniref:Uncharacterized protein n=1 Tax=Pleuronectes platessa TaxID=8262 RepID=A0A9N7VJY8_PLEPL|nr:unnamed protein product [Pleuronectes platessa]
MTADKSPNVPDANSWPGVHGLCGLFGKLSKASHPATFAKSALTPAKEPHPSPWWFTKQELIYWVSQGARARQLVSCDSSHSGPIHSHIQFPALSIHHCAHFVSADFILAAAITSEQGPSATGELFHLPSASPRSADRGP